MEDNWKVGATREKVSGNSYCRIVGKNRQRFRHDYLLVFHR